MEIKALICPQCGGEITNYVPGQPTATCGYCGMRFVVEPKKEERAELPAPVYHEIDDAPDDSPNRIAAVGGAVFAIIVGIAIIGGLASWNTKKTTNPPPKSRTPTPVPTTRIGGSTAAPQDLLNFGGSGTENGQFKDASSVAVDKLGQIYVSDDSMRVQQFDPAGRFIKAIQIPKKGANYEHARTIDKIAVGDDGRIYVAVGGVLQIYDGKSSTAVRTIHVAPDYIQDFALKSDGGMLAISDNDREETLLFVNKAGAITRRLRGFHTNALDAAISPQETAVAAIRLATDKAGNIFSVYALGDLGSYSISSNNEDLMVARFTPDGKFVKKFVQSMNSCGISTDSKGRIYVTEGNSIGIYSNNGEPANSIAGFDGITAFALDKDDNVFVISKDRVLKRPAAE